MAARKPKAEAADVASRINLYADGEFERVHAAGSMILTASNVAALFGHSPWSGRFGLACHMTGAVPFEEVGGALVERGKLLEEVSAKMVAREKGWQVEPVFGYAEHPVFGRRVLASPDMLARAEGKPGMGIGEGKVVAGPIFQDRWADGPPLYVELQHQLQFACTGAAWGFISALIIGDFRMDLVVYETAPNVPAIKVIDEAIEPFLAILDAGQMPEPDPHADSVRALHSLYPKADPGLIALVEDEESIKLFDQCVEARDFRLVAEKVEDRAKRWFKAKAEGAGMVKLPGGRSVRVKVVERAESTTKASSYRKLDFEHAKPTLPAPAKRGKK